MEITATFDISLEEENLLDMHSVLNILNVIIYELLELGDILGEPEILDQSIQEVRNLADKLTNRDEALSQVNNVEQFVQTIASAMNTLRTKQHSQASAQIDKSMENLQSIFDVLRVRAKEIVARADNPHAWVHHDITQLKSNFFQVFKAIELNSNGNYHIVGNIARYEKGDYFLTLEIDSVDESSIFMPAVFQDVIRDLIANARKYTDPGGEIIAGLYQSEAELRFVVADTGRGIPEDEINKAIHFGFRGTNVQDRPTRGGGFGLTKTYYVTRKHKGRMWIDPREPQGTRIEIRIPLPESRDSIL